MDLCLLYSHLCRIHLRWNMHYRYVWRGSLMTTDFTSWGQAKPTATWIQKFHQVFRGTAVCDCSVSFTDCCWVLLMCSLLSTSAFKPYQLILSCHQLQLAPWDYEALPQATLLSFVHSPPQSVCYINHACNFSNQSWCIWKYGFTRILNWVSRHTNHRDSFQGSPINKWKIA